MYKGKNNYCICFFTMLLAHVITIHAYSQESGPRQSGRLFTLFNGIHYKNTPDLSRQSVHRLNLVYESRIVKPNPDLAADLIPNADSISNIAAIFIPQPDIPVTLDIESWSYSPAQLQVTISKYLEVIRDFKRVNSRSKLDFYGVVPKTAFTWEKIQPIGGPKEFENAIMPLVMLCEIAFS